jgi:hypothetical protein
VDAIPTRARAQHDRLRPKITQGYLAARKRTGWIIALDCSDLREMLERHMLPAPEEPDDLWEYLRQRLDRLIL